MKGKWTRTHPQVAGGVLVGEDGVAYGHDPSVGEVDDPPLAGDDVGVILAGGRARHSVSAKGKSRKIPLKKEPEKSLMGSRFSSLKAHRSYKVSGDHRLGLEDFFYSLLPSLIFQLAKTSVFVKRSVFLFFSSRHSSRQLRLKLSYFTSNLRLVK